MDKEQQGPVFVQSTVRMNESPLSRYVGSNALHDLAAEIWRIPIVTPFGSLDSRLEG
jgi:hypothetical protein